MFSKSQKNNFFKGERDMFDLHGEMERRRLAQRNEAGRGNHSGGIYTPYSGGSSLTSGDRIIKSSVSTSKSSSGKTGRYLGNGQYVED